MSTPFPALLRRTSFASYDPLITRVYSSPNPSSGDYGLKYTHPKTKGPGPKYLKVHGLDGGKVITTEYTSGEREARWMEAWGNGKVKWISSAEYDRRDTKFTKNSLQKGPSVSEMLDSPSSSASTSSSSTESTAEKIETRSKSSSPLQGEMFIDDIESMSSKDFEKYLETIRSRRSTTLNTRLSKLSPTEIARLPLSGDKTMVNLSISGNTTKHDTPDQQTLFSHEQIFDNKSSKLINREHRLSGLSYSRGPNLSKSSQGYTSPIFSFPGRVVDQLSSADTMARRLPGKSNNIFGNNFNNNNKSRNNRNGRQSAGMIVSAGGITGATSRQTTSFTDGDENTKTQVFDVIDYSRSQKTLGEGIFIPSSAIMITPPQVLGLKDSSAPYIWTNNFNLRQSKAVKPKPMETMDFDIDLDTLQAGSYGDVGVGEWVGKRPGAPVKETREDGLGRSGGSDKPYGYGSGMQGKSTEFLGNWQRETKQRQEQSVVVTTQSINNLLDRLKTKEHNEDKKENS